MEHTKLKFKVNQNHVARVEQCLKHIIHLISQLFHFFKLFSIRPTQGNRLRLVHHWIAKRIVLKEQFESWWRQFLAFLNTQATAQ